MRWPARQGKPKKRGGFLVGHGLGFRHNAFKYRAPDDKAVAACPAILLRQLLPRHLFPVFVLLDFLLAALNLGGQFPRVFSLGFVMAGRSFLPVGIEKGQSIFSAVPCG